MKQLQNILLIVVTTVFIFNACELPESFPETPEVEFKSLYLADSVDILGNEIKLVKVTLTVKDGDGDVGIMLESGGIYPGFEDLGNANLFLTLYEKVDGEFVEVEFEAPHHYATPYLEPEGQDKTLKGDIEVSIEYSQSLYTYDTIKYSFYLYDRAMHISNVAETPVIPADTLGLIE